MRWACAGTVIWACSTRSMTGAGRSRTLSVHHESAAGFIADAYYRIRHQPLATFTSVGPGTANLPVALGSAFMDASAFLAITGNVPTTQFNRAPFQETGRYYQADTPAVLRPYVKRSFQATRADQLPLMLRQAFAAMLGGRPGPVHLDVPLDVFRRPPTRRCPIPAVAAGHLTPGGRGAEPTWPPSWAAAGRGPAAADRGRVRRAERGGDRGTRRVRRGRPHPGGHLTPGQGRR